MIVEHEILEQILDDEWPLARAISFVDSFGKNGWTVLKHHWHDGNVQLISPDGSALPEWVIRDIFRNEDMPDANVQVRVTDKGLRLV